MPRSMTIGQMASAVGCNVRTIRYYERVGLLTPPPRTTGNQRRYGPDDVQRLGFVRHARELGFSLDAIRSLLALSDRPDQSCRAVTEIARTRLAEVEDRLRHLTALKQALTTMIGRCGGGAIADCRIVEALATRSPARPPAGPPTRPPERATPPERPHDGA